MAAYEKMLLKKSLAVSLPRFSGVVIPLTGGLERLVGQSERSIFVPVDCLVIP
jgi:hypothetical protein